MKLGLAKAPIALEDALYFEGRYAVPMSLSYAWQKANTALSCLVSECPQIQRMTYAGQELSSFPIKGLPLEVARAALETEKAFTLWPNSPEFATSEGHGAALMEYLPESRRSMLAEKVVHLHRVIAEALGARNAGFLAPEVPDDFELTSPHKWEFLYWNLPGDATSVERTKYIDYARHWLPNFPAEVLLEWQGRHGYDGMRHWAHLDLEKIAFQDVTWSYDQLAKIKSVDPKFVAVGPNTQGNHHINRLGDWIGTYIREHGTWSSPIIVIDHPAAEPKGRYDVPAGLVLIEGHSRLSRMLNYIPANTTVPMHKVMLAKVAKPGPHAAMR